MKLRVSKRQPKRWLVVSYVNLTRFESIKELEYFDIGDTYLDMPDTDVFKVAYENEIDGDKARRTIYPLNKKFLQEKMNATVIKQMFLLPHDVFYFYLEEHVFFPKKEDDYYQFNLRLIELMKKLKFDWLDTIISQCKLEFFRHLGIYKKNDDNYLQIVDPLIFEKSKFFNVDNLEYDFYRIINKFLDFNYYYEKNNRKSIMDMIGNNVDFRPLIFIQQYSTSPLVEGSYE